FLPPHLTSEFEEKERFIHEAKAASALNHTNITTIYEIDEFEGQMFIVMEYVEGKTLKQAIEKEALSIKKVLDIGIQICEGLAMAHEKGIVHRDIKSDNIMLTPSGQVKIMDFGLAKLKGATKLTKTRSTLGTLAYMSPEQAQGEEVDQRSDIFSFGVVLYELLTGKLPFAGEHQAAVIYSIINEEPQPIARFNNQVSAKLEDMVYKALVKEKDERYQHIDDLLADLRRERKSLDYLKTGQIPKEVILPKPKRKVLPIAIPASVVVILVLLFLILKPFKFEIAPEKGAIAKENSLAVMYFDNLVDPEDKQKLGEIVTNLLITGLSESQYLKVVSSQRLYDILKLLGREGEKRIDKNMATQVATKAGVKWMLLGSILQVKPRIEITTQLVDVGTGEIKASQRITGEKEQDIFSLVDKLTVALKKDFSLPVSAQQEKEPSVAKVTTHSQEAYRYYLEGTDYCYKLYFAEAERSFNKALELDSTFAMAYYWLAVTKNYEGDTRAARESITKAAKYTDKITHKEKLYIEGFEAYVTGDYPQAIKVLKKIVESYPDEKQAFFTLGHIYYRNLHQSEEAIHYLNKAIQIDPLYKMVYNLLAYAYDAMGDFDKSIWAINKYIELAPDEPNPYDTRGDLYARNGKLDQAIESYKKALEKKPDFYLSRWKLGDMYVFKKDYAKAESCFQALSSSSEKFYRSMGRLYLKHIPFYQGKFEDALKVLDDGIAADRMEQFESELNAYKHFDKAFLLCERQKKMGLALKEAEIGMEIYKKAKPDDPIYGRDGYAFLLTKSGKIAEAEELAKALKKDIEEKNPKLMFSYWWTLGDIELIKRDTNMALSYLERAYKDSPTPSFDLRCHLAEIYLNKGRLDEAVSQLEKALSRYDDDRVWSSRAVKAYYLLGLAYEKSGWTKKAIEQYEQFLDIWKNADPGIPEIADAKERLKKLKANSRQ
ncbi:MAG: protein kinase, partial [candidate division Zixibacteria bacterium]|nr:protein kinase [candidate division Zixibacteria bacterium]